MKKSFFAIAGLLLLTSTHSWADRYVDLGPQKSPRCDENKLCLFEDTHYRGRFGVTQAPVKNIGLGGALDRMAWLRNDTVSSIANNTGIFWCVYTDGSFRGDRMLILPHAKIPNVGNRFNDKFSSVRPFAC